MKNDKGRTRLGKKGEDLACDFLSERGHVILERNLRTGNLETDVVSIDGNGVHFVEVKSRTAPCARLPQENVGILKQRRLTRAALKYMNGTKDGRISPDSEVHFDVVSIVFDGEKIGLDYIPDAFIPMYT